MTAMGGDTYRRSSGFGIGGSGAAGGGINVFSTSLLANGGVGASSSAMAMVPLSSIAGTTSSSGFASLRSPGSALVGLGPSTRSAAPRTPLLGLSGPRLSSAPEAGFGYGSPLHSGAHVPQSSPQVPAYQQHHHAAPSSAAKPHGLGAHSLKIDLSEDLARLRLTGSTSKPGAGIKGMATPGQPRSASKFGGRRQSMLVGASAPLTPGLTVGDANVVMSTTATNNNGTPGGGVKQLRFNMTTSSSPLQHQQQQASTAADSMQLAGWMVNQGADNYGGSSSVLAPSGQPICGPGVDPDAQPVPGTAVFVVDWPSVPRPVWVSMPIDRPASRVVDLVRQAHATCRAWLESAVASAGDAGDADAAISVLADLGRVRIPEGVHVRINGGDRDLNTPLAVFTRGGPGSGTLGVSVTVIDRSRLTGGSSGNASGAVGRPSFSPQQQQNGYLQQDRYAQDQDQQDVLRHDGGRRIGRSSLGTAQQQQQTPLPPQPSGAPSLGHLTSQGYYTVPPVETLQHYSDNELKAVTDFTVGRDGEGSITWPGTTDVRGLHLDAIVRIVGGDVMVYQQAPRPAPASADDSGADDIEAAQAAAEISAPRPPKGQGLNKRARITILGVVPSEDEYGRPNVRGTEATLREHTASMRASFLAYDPGQGAWTFEIPHL